MRETVSLRAAADGQVILPKAVLEALGFSGDEEVTLTIVDGAIRLEPESVAARVARVQETYRRYEKTPYTTDDFLRDRKAEAAADDAAL